MRRIVLTVLLLVTVAFAMPTSAPCPIDGVNAPYTGHYREVTHSDGKHILCEYSHPVSSVNGTPSTHNFWQDCTNEF